MTDASHYGNTPQCVRREDGTEKYTENEETKRQKEEKQTENTGFYFGKEKNFS